MPNDDTLFLKSKVNILSFFNEEQLRKVTPDISRKTYAKGETVLFQGQVGDGFYIIKKGGVRATMKAKSGQQPEPRDFAAGDFFGEISVLEDAASAETIKAIEDGTEILTIPHGSFQKLMEMQPILKNALLEKAAARKKA